MLHFNERGEGRRTDLLLHGFLGSGRNLGSLARRLGEGVGPGTQRRCILPDLPGHGQSPPLPSDRASRSLELIAQRVLELADHLDLSCSTRVIGHSIGGRVGLKMRALSPHRLGELVLVDISPGPTTHLVGNKQTLFELFLKAPAATNTRGEMRQYFTERGVAGPLADWLLTNLTRSTHSWRLDRQALADLHAHAALEDLWLILEKWAQGMPPIRCIRGGRSAFVSDEDVARMEAAGCKVDTIAEAGHFVHVDALPALLSRLLADDV